MNTQQLEKLLKEKEAARGRAFIKHKEALEEKDIKSAKNFLNEINNIDAEIEEIKKDIEKNNSKS